MEIKKFDNFEFSGMMEFNLQPELRAYINQDLLVGIHLILLYYEWVMFNPQRTRIEILDNRFSDGAELLAKWLAPRNLHKPTKIYTNINRQYWYIISAIAHAYKLPSDYIHLHLFMYQATNMKVFIER